MRVKARALIIQDDCVLLIEYRGGSPRQHYNLPGGRVEAGETITEALHRELLEEANCRIENPRLRFVIEHDPKQTRDSSSEDTLATFIFSAELKVGEIACMPEEPDPNQTGVKWIPSVDLTEVLLFPEIKRQLLADRFGDGVKHLCADDLEHYNMPML